MYRAPVRAKNVAKTGKKQLVWDLRVGEEIWIFGQNDDPCDELIYGIYVGFEE